MPQIPSYDTDTLDDTDALLGTNSGGTVKRFLGTQFVKPGELATGVAAFLATPTSANLAAALTDETGSGANVFATSPTLVTPALGTPSSGIATNITGLPISTGVSGLASGVATFLATPSSANLATVLTDETGSGANVFATSPTLVTPILGTPTSATLTNATGLPVSTGISGLGTNVATFLATPNSANLAAALTDETGSGANVFASGPTLVAPNLGTPASGTMTNVTGLPISSGVSGLAAGVATFLGTPTSANLAAALTDETGTGANVFATSPTLVTPTLGTPASATLTNATGLPVSTGISGLGSGVSTFLATPSSANLAAAVTGETGSGALVFATAPTVNAPVIITNSGAGVYGFNINAGPTQLISTDLGCAGFTFHRSGAYAVHMTLDPDNAIRIGGWSDGIGSIRFTVASNGQIITPASGGLICGSGGISTTGNISVGPNADIYTTRSDGTGVIFLGQTATPHYLYWNGASYSMPNGPLSISDSTASTNSFNGALVVGGGIGANQVRAETCHFGNSGTGGIYNEKVNIYSGYVANQWSLGVQAYDTGVLYLNYAGAGYYAYFCQDSTSNIVGTITHSTSGVAYNTTSDGRKKPIRAPIEDALGTINQLNPVRHNWLNEPDQWNYGLVAQEAYEVLPQMVTKGDDNPDLVPGDEDFRAWQADYSRAVPHLIAAIQQLDATRIQLEQRIAALEGKL